MSRRVRAVQGVRLKFESVYTGVGSNPTDGILFGIKNSIFSSKILVDDQKFSSKFLRTLFLHCFCLVLCLIRFHFFSGNI